MGLFQGDVIIRQMLELGIQDLRQQPWLLNDIFSSFITNQYLKDKYGQSQIDAAKEWITNNQVDIYMYHRADRDRLPCITIEMSSTNEKSDMKHMGDNSTEKVLLSPQYIGKPIPYIVKPFVPTGYNQSTGILSVAPTTPNLANVVPGQIVVNPANGNGYPIIGLVASGVIITPGTPLIASELGISPEFPFYKARIEHTFFQETFNIGVHVSGDPQALLWLWAITLYSLLRYKESLLEANGFAEGVFTNSNVDLNSSFTTDGGERAWSRYITITGQTEHTWIKSPQRFIENVSLSNPSGGLVVASNSEPTIIDEQQQLWHAIQDIEE